MTVSLTTCSGRKTDFTQSSAVCIRYTQNKLARKFFDECNTLIQSMWLVAADRFVEVSQTTDFLFLPSDRICRLLSDNMLIVNSELDVFTALLRWLDYDRDGRLCHAAHLLQDAVRLHCIDPECIVSNVETVDWLFDAVPECQVVANEAMRSAGHICIVIASI